MKRSFLILIGFIFLVSTLAFCQPQVGEPPVPPAPPDEEDIEKMEVRMRIFRMWKLTEELDLSEDQATKFLPKFNRFQDSVKEIRDKNMEIVRKIRGLIAAEETGGKLNSYVDQIEDNEKKIIALNTDFRKEAEEVLTDIQMAKFVVFQHEFPKRMRRAIHRGGPSGDNIRPGRSIRGNREPHRMRGPGIHCDRIALPTFEYGKPY